MCVNRLTSGQTSSNKRDVVALETQTVSQEVPQLVVAGEVDDGGWYSHNPAHTHKGQVPYSNICYIFFFFTFTEETLTVSAVSRSTETGVLRVG